ncbi:hypothetical protein [Flaviflexus massiliensis]|uniref:hypothetical protein n=1 Tax=Flaviflexus massiliensis TaxID=1522309 RepID=UPI0012B505BB|nr:hypothetical protein [Flaviflexus massiliensis]
MKQILGLIPIAIGAIGVFTDILQGLTIPLGLIALTCGAFALKDAVRPARDH